MPRPAWNGPLQRSARHRAMAADSSGPVLSETSALPAVCLNNRSGGWPVSEQVRIFACGNPHEKTCNLLVIYRFLCKSRTVEPQPRQPFASLAFGVQWQKPRPCSISGRMACFLLENPRIKTINLPTRGIVPQPATTGTSLWNLLISSPQLWVWQLPGPYKTSRWRKMANAWTS